MYVSQMSLKRRKYERVKGTRKVDNQGTIDWANIKNNDNQTWKVQI